MKRKLVNSLIAGTMAAILCVSPVLAEGAVTGNVQADEVSVEEEISTDDTEETSDAEEYMSVSVDSTEIERSVENVQGIEDDSLVIETEGEKLPVWDGPIASDFSGGDGTQSNPYRISNVSELAYFLQSDRDYRDKYILFTKDISIDDGSSKNEWRGYLYGQPYANIDGGEHIVYGLRNSCLIASCESISNLTIGNAYYDTADQGVGFCKNATIINNCHINGLVNINKTSASSIDCIGRASTIKDSTNHMDVTVGAREGADILIHGIGVGNIFNCVNSANITYKGVQDEFKYYQGYETSVRICGIGEGGVIADCTNEGDLTGGVQALGIGTARVQIADCVNKGEIKDSILIAGIGVIGGGGDPVDCVSFENCVNEGRCQGNLFTERIYGIGTTDDLYICSGLLMEECVNNGDLIGELSDRCVVMGIGDPWFESERVEKIDILYCVNNGDLVGNEVAGISDGFFLNDVLCDARRPRIDRIDYKYRIANCENNGEIKAGESAAGIVRHIYHSLSDEYSSGIYTLEINIEDCDNNGKINSAHGAYGILGYMDSDKMLEEMYGEDNESISFMLKVSHCRNSGDLVADNESYAYAAGIIGRVRNCDLQIESCNNNAVVKGHDAAGIALSAAVSNIDPETKKEYIKKEIIKDCVNKGGIQGKDSAYGIIDTVCNGEMTNCINMGMISATRACGIFRDAYNSEIKNCSNQGDINAYDGYYTTEAYAFCYLLKESTIHDCYNSGKIEAQKPEDSKSSGKAAMIYGVENYSSDRIIYNCYNSGAIIDYSINGSMIANYRAPENKSGIIDHVYNINVYEHKHEKEIKYLSFEEMKDPETFSGFDFDNVWAMGDDHYPYPILKEKEDNSNGSEEYDPIEPLKKKFDAVSVRLHDRGFARKVPFNWDETQFKNSGRKYNHNIANMCVSLSALAYDETIFEESVNKNEYMHTLKKDLMFSDVQSFYEDDEGDSICYSIASKSIQLNDKKVDLVFLVMRGTYNWEWVTNFDPKTGNIHDSFNSGANDAFIKLKKYIQEKNLGSDDSELKIIVTGHSRGAATANIVGKLVIDDKLVDVRDAGNEKYSNDLFVYTFATPNVTTDDNREQYSNIYNIVNPEDFVTKVMPSAWGYGRYGTTYVFPNLCLDSDLDYNQFKKGVTEGVSKQNGGEYVSYPKGMLTVSKYVNYVTSSCSTVQDYYSYNLDAGGYSLKDVYTKTLGYYMCNIDGYKAKGRYNFIQAGAFLYTELGLETFKFFFSNEVLDPYFEYAHMCETYLAAMNTISEADLKINRKMYKNIVNCPVDVMVKDSNGEIVESIENNKVITEKDDSISAYIYGDTKEIWIPADGKYEIELKGNDNGAMDYIICEIDADRGEEKRVIYKTLPVQREKSYELDFDNLDSLDNASLIDSTNTVVSPDSIIKSSDNVDTYDVNVTVEGIGSANSVYNLYYGDCARMKAVCDQNNEFYGWYDENENLLSDELEYNFVPNRDMNIVARFSSVIVNSTGIDMQRTLEMNVGEMKYLEAKMLPANSTDWHIQYSSSDTTIATVTDEGIIKALGTGEVIIEAKALADNKIANSCKVIIKENDGFDYNPIITTNTDTNEPSGIIGNGDDNQTKQENNLNQESTATPTQASKNSNNANKKALVAPVIAQTKLNIDSNGNCFDMPYGTPEKKNSSLWKGKLRYSVKSSSTNSPTVVFEGVISDVKSVKIPDTVTFNGVKYKVTEISSCALCDKKKLQSVTIGKNVKKIGSLAFDGSKKLKKIVIKSQKLTSKNVKKCFGGTSKKLTITVPKSKYKSYNAFLKKKGNKNVKVKK